MLSSDVLIICFLSLYIARDTELFEKRIKPWELPVHFLSEKIYNKSKERNSALILIFKQYHLLSDSIMTLCTPYCLSPSLILE